MIHCYIPDTQAKPGVPTKHLEWIGRYLLEKRPDKIIHAGDHSDMPSLSTYDRGKRAFEGRRYKADIQAANEAWEILNGPIDEYNARKRSYKSHNRQYRPEKHITLGNHEHRITRATELDAVLDGTIGVQDLDYEKSGWKVHPFLEVADIDGVWYSHYFYNPLSGKPWGGMVITRLKNIGHSFTQGHTQTLDHAMRYVGNQQQHGLVAGACYLHHEDYKGPQGNEHWRGIIMKHEVRNGAYDPMFVSLDFLCRKYEKKPLHKFMERL